MTDEQSTTTTLTSKKSRKNFGWHEKHVEDLVNCIISYKTKIKYRGLGFDGDMPWMYKELKKSKAEIYQNADMNIFGAVNVTDFSNENTKNNIYQSKNIKTICKRKTTSIWSSK